MLAIIINEEKYVESYSSEYRTPESILVDELPEEDPEKLKFYQYIEAAQAEAARKNEIMHQIASLKETIDSTDYQIIKCYEYALNKLELPYDAAALHEERQALRDQINELEQQLKA